MIDVNGKNNKVEQKNNKKIKTMGDVTLKGYDMTNTVTKGTGVRVHKQWAHAEHDKETKSERAANRRAGERVVSLEVEVSALTILGKNFFFVEGTHGS